MDSSKIEKVNKAKELVDNVLEFLDQYECGHERHTTFIYFVSAIASATLLRVSQGSEDPRAFISECSLDLIMNLSSSCREAMYFRERADEPH